jgi:hypothetical protein
LSSVGTVAQIFFSRVSFPPEAYPPLAEKRFRVRIVYRKVGVVYGVKTKDETNIRNRYVAKTQTDPYGPKVGETRNGFKQQPLFRPKDFTLKVFSIGFFSFKSYPRLRTLYEKLSSPS